MPRSVCTIRASLLAAVLASGLSNQDAIGQVPADSPRRTPTVVAVEAAKPSVVNIHGRKLLRSEAQQGESYRPVNGMGTGVVIDERGYIVTNFHVVEGVGRIKVTLDDNHVKIARLINHDPRTDLAIIKVDSSSPLPVIKMGTSSDLMVGETVIAMGNAYGYKHTVTRGIVSALGRTVPVTDEQTYHDLIQTDASINPGNSGGPLLNQEGDMIGINVAMRVGAQGIGFALPIDEAMDVVARLLSVERLSGFSHGVVGRTEIVKRAPHFIVDTVRDGTPAARSGLQKGDVVLRVAGVTVDRALDFERALIGRSPGDSVTVSVQRDGEENNLELSLGESARTVAATRTNSVSSRLWSDLGLRVAVTAGSNPHLSQTNYNGGLKVVDVRPESPAAKEGFQNGDILVGMHRWETASMNDIAYILNSSEFRKSQPAKFFIVRGSEVLYGYLTTKSTSQVNFKSP